MLLDIVDLDSKFKELQLIFCLTLIDIFLKFVDCLIRICFGVNITKWLKSGVFFKRFSFLKRGHFRFSNATIRIPVIFWVLIMVLLCFRVLKSIVVYSIKYRQNVKFQRYNAEKVGLLLLFLYFWIQTSISQCKDYQLFIDCFQLVCFFCLPFHQMKYSSNIR